MLSYSTLSDAELERWVYTSPWDVRAFDEVLTRFSSGKEKYTQDELDSAVYDAETQSRNDAYDEGYADGERGAHETLA